MPLELEFSKKVPHPTVHICTKVVYFHGMLWDNLFLSILVSVLDNKTAIALKRYSEQWWNPALLLFVDLRKRMSRKR